MENNNTAGYYQVGTEKINHKLLATLRASQTKLPLTWHFYDDLYSNQPTAPGDIDVRELYRQRAMQLRETYDYLILNYSGGVDSWTILHTFLSNNIKLDQITVKWPLKAMDRGWYTPNSKDKSAQNSVSEWDFVLKKDLAWLAQSHPEIKIELVDWIDDLDSNKIDDNVIQTTNLHRFYYSNILRVSKTSSIAKSLALAGKKVASILGIDKPQIVEKENRCFFYFTDSQFLTQENNLELDASIENFYWTPSFPEITIKQAQKLFQWYKHNSSFRNLIKAPSERTDARTWKLPDWYKNMEDKTSITKMLVYPDWDFSRFQAFKPIPKSSDLTGIMDLAASPKDLWMEQHLPLDGIKQQWAHHWVSYIKEISPIYLLPGAYQMKPIDSKWHYIGDF